MGFSDAHRLLLEELEGALAGLGDTPQARHCWPATPALTTVAWRAQKVRTGKPPWMWYL